MKCKGLEQFGSELAAIARNKKVLIPVLAVLAVPVMYTAMFLGAFWDPYANMEDLPVAVVNSDRGADLDGESLRIGDEFVAKLKENPKFDWSFVSLDDAAQGLQDKAYYMAIEIPADFSEKAASLATDHPEQAVLNYLPNEGYNFLAAQIGNTAVEQMRTSLNKEVTETYAETVFAKLEAAADGIVQAGDGASRIADGAGSATDGAVLLADNMAKLADGTAALREGASKLDAAGARLSAGSADAYSGAVKLSDGLTQLAAGGARLSEGASGAGEGAAKLAQGLTASVQGTEQLQQGASSLAAGLSQLAAANPALGESEGFQALVAGSKQLEAGLGQSLAGQRQLQAGAEQLQQGAGTLSKGAEQLAGKLEEASGGAAQLTAGLEKLDGGSSQLAAGLSQLDSSAETLASGAGKLRDGTAELASGLTELADGSAELAGKLGDASVEADGLSLSGDMAGIFAEPIRLDVQRVAEVPNYGTGFAPYFVSLGLYVGALLITIVYALREPAVRPSSGWSWFWSKALTLATVGVIQALIADAALIFLLKLEVQNMPMFILLSIVTSLTFMALIQFLVTAMGNPGRFIAIILLILQLTSSAGTFPLELIPGWMQHVTPWLPMTYTVAGLKDAVSIGDAGRMWSDAGWLLGCMGVFSMLTLVYFTAVHRREQSEGAEPSAELNAAM